MMETTPRTRSSTRYRRVPTPKMSERKKKLFEDVLNNGDSPTARNPYVRLERLIVEENEDSDLGPMSPLEFSSSPSSFHDVHRIFERDQKENARAHRIDFTDILNDEDRSNDSNKKIVQNRANSTASAPTAVALDRCTKDDGNMDSGGEEDMMGPLCNSMKKLTSMTEQQNYEQQMKTPSDVSTTSKLTIDQCGRNASFRKSLVFDSSLTPNDDTESSPTSKSSDHDHNATNSGGSGGGGGGSGSSSSAGPKAKTSLTFNEPTISVRSFYGKSIEKPPAVVDVQPPKRNNDLIEKIHSHEFGAAIAAVAAKHKMKFKSKSKSKSQMKSRSLSQRMKAKAAPSLWRFSGKAKFNHHKRHSRHNKSLNKSKTKLNTSTKSVSSSAGGGGGGGGDAITDVENVPPPGSEFTSRIEQNLRLQKILKEQPNAMSVSREINWIGGGANSKSTTEATTQNRSGFLNSDAEDDDDDSDTETQHRFDAAAAAAAATLSNQCTYEEVEVDVEDVPTNRKFFKSKSSDSAKKYRIMGRLSATLKRGGDLKFDPPPKRKKKRSNKGEETVVLHNEITSIIDRLSSPGKGKTQRQTNEPSDDDDDDHMPARATQPKSSAMETNTMITNTSHHHHVEPDFIDKMQTEMNNSSIGGDGGGDGVVIAENPVVIFTNDTEKYRQMIPYNTDDPEKISQQESILELLISNGICDDETFKIFIAEPDLHKDKASQILDSLYCVDTMISNEYENEAATEWINSVESMATTTSDTAISIETNAIVHEIPGSLNESAAVVSSPPSLPNTHDDDQQSDKLFPIFQKNFNATGSKAPTFSTLTKPSKDWIPIGDQQYQLDVGQKEFGLRTCPQCEMQYSVHEPEDELLHQEYHNRVKILTFKGWNNERVVTQISDWNPPGRIIYVCESDSKAKKDRVKEVLAMVDRDLGFATGAEMKPKTLVYFAIVKEQIVGVCVAQPLERAHRMKTENGIDCYTIESYPVRCGISRIWVAPQYRRHGIAAKLITSMRGHFLFGAFLSFDEIAFSSPTEDGKKFAAKLAQRSDFLIYES